MRELIGQPSSEILKQLIVQNDTISHFFLAGREIAYYKEEAIHLSSSAKLYTAPQQLFSSETPVKPTLSGVVNEPYITLLSRVMMVDGFGVIPMLDYESKDTEALKSGLHKYNMPAGYIVSSGNGLHYWGIKIISEDGLPTYLANLRSFRADDDAVDNHWLYKAEADQIMELRVNANDFKPIEPTVIDTFSLDYRSWIDCNKEYQLYDRMFMWPNDFVPNP